MRPAPRLICALAFLGLACAAHADPLADLSDSVTDLFSRAESARAHARQCAGQTGADRVALGDALAGWSHRNDAADYDALMAALKDAAPGLAEQTDAAFAQIDAAVAQQIAAKPQLCAGLPERLKSDEYALRPALRETRRIARDLGVRPADPVPPRLEPGLAAAVQPLAQFSAWASAAMAEIGSAPGAQSDPALRKAREEYLLALLEPQGRLMFQGRVVSDSELREWHGDRQSSFAASCRRFSDQDDQQRMADLVGHTAVLTGKVYWVRDDAPGGVVGLRDCRILDAAAAGLPLAGDGPVELEPRPPELAELLAAPGPRIAPADVDRVLYTAEFSPRLDGAGNGYLDRQEDIWVLLRDGTAMRHDWPVPFGDLALDMSRAREPQRWFTWVQRDGAVVLTAADGTTLDLSGAERLLPMPEGRAITGTWAMTDIAMGGLRRDRSFDFAGDGTLLHGSDSFVGGRVGTSFITSPLGPEQQTRSAYRFQGYALILIGPEGEERHFAARLADGDPAAPDDLVIDGRVYWRDGK
ncbi:hypothetical protein SAMN05421641_1175 [Paracoccus thiocyanatus]|uniref:Uncharacterized protein n=1 Tax=Paracoccus thiocyanatus TaxID=34006 RepID=A0A1N6WIL6_9RHOB|nr:hypothetical protein [Paracoccus thiocyanatus]SIQ89874.1 hypothetical protein SAMN05421641_1175 [Paracoccus thiocyanatus]